MKRVLWLCSWYPNRIKPFEGDFVQRHAQAASLSHYIDVIKLCPDESIQSADTVFTKGEQYPHLTETRIYYPYKKSTWSRIRNVSLWRALYKKAIEAYIEENGLPDLVHVHIPFKDGLLALWMKKKYGLEYVVTEHWGGYNNVLQDNFNDRPVWFRRIVAKVIKQASMLHSVSRFNLDKMRQHLKYIPEPVVFPNVVNTDLFFPVNKSSLPAGPLQFLHISDGDAIKNAEGIIQVFKDLDPGKYRLTVVGFAAAKNTTYAAQYTGIRFVGQVPYEQIPAYLQAADALVVFSHMENSPCVITEAICCNTFVIATAVGGISELVNGKNSILVHAGDEAALKNTIINFKPLDKDGIALSGQFSYQAISERFALMYQQVLNK